MGQEDTPLNFNCFSDFAAMTIYVLDDRWIIDSGASSHIIGTLNLLSNIKKKD